MKGFLFRVASSVVRPQTSVHPIVDSIYSSPAPHAASMPTSEQEAISSAPIAHTIQTESQIGASESATTEEHVSKVYPAQRIAKTSRRDSFEPLLPPQEPSQLAAPVKDSAATEASALATHTGSQQDSQSLSATLGFTPIVSHAVNVGSPTSKLVPSQTQANEQKAVTQSRRQQQSHPAVRARREAGDDIQIHIGRIEVIAIPPPAPRPAAGTPHRRMSLDEYLNRRNGRTG